MSVSINMSHVHEMTNRTESLSVSISIFMFSGDQVTRRLVHFRKRWLNVLYQGNVASRPRV